MRHVPHRRGAGLLQAAIPKGPRSEDARRASGLNLRGVIVKLYPRDDPPPGTSNPAASYASVLTYGARRLLLPRVQISQPLGSETTGLVGGLRPSTQASSGELDLDHIDAAALDGSHVVISFFDDDLAQPYISAVLEHPRAIEAVRLSKSDPDPLLIHWQGASWGLDGAQDFVIDLDFEAARSENHGHIRLVLPQHARLTVTVGGENALVIERGGAAARLVLGDGAASGYILAELTRLAAASTPPSPAPAMPPPSWDDAIASAQLKIPSG
jgi:hypothetical protein